MRRQIFKRLLPKYRRRISERYIRTNSDYGLNDLSEVEVK